MCAGARRRFAASVGEGELEIYLFLLDCQGQRLQLGVFGFEDLGVEAVVVLLGVR
jgi:hypothetical protein